MLLLLIHLSLALQVHAQGKWEFYAYSGLPGMLSYGRLDPIVSPGAVSGHVHQIQGANGISSTYDHDTLRRQSTCTTIQVQDDLSNYWAPALYSYNGAANFSLMLAGFHVYYQFQTFSYDANNPKGSARRYAFPKNLTMLAGNMFQRQLNYSNPASVASKFVCSRASGGAQVSYDMRDFQRAGRNCDLGLSATTRFPSCWDGAPNNTDLVRLYSASIRLDSIADLYKTHVVYPNPIGVCPQSHPYAFMQLSLEWSWPVQNFPFDPKREDNWVFSFGDTSGFGFHGDFANGWNITLLEQAIAKCNVSENSIENCAPFAKWNGAQIPPCMPSSLYPNESVGLDGQSLSALPGCNPVWRDNSTKPTCSPAPAAPCINKRLGPDLSQWNYLACPFSYTTKNRVNSFILTAHTRLNWANMTVDSCLAECSGYKYAMTAFGNACYCDNEIRANGSTVSDPHYPCQVRCPSRYLQFCGGYGTGELFQACTGAACQFNVAYPKASTKTC